MQCDLGLVCLDFVVFACGTWRLEIGDLLAMKCWYLRL